MTVARARLSAEPYDAAAWLRLGARLLDQAGIDSAALDASLLLAKACGIERAQLLARSFALTSLQTRRFRAMLARRAAREPLAYIVGRKEFFSLELLVSPSVLIPRPETETLVEAALEWARGHRVERILELGTGSGAIALALASHLTHTRIVATDVSARALKLARANARRLGLADVVEFRCGDLWLALRAAGGARRPFDMVLANPPYIGQREFDRLAPEVRKYEPKIALLAGADGLSFYHRIARELKDHLTAEGYAAFEVGLGQAARVAEILRRAGVRRTRAFRDLSGMQRVVTANF